MVIVENEWFILEQEVGRLYVTVLKKGCSLLEMDRLISGFPRVRITKFKELKEAIQTAETIRTEVGEYRPLIECAISPDKMSASVRINCTEDHLQMHLSAIISECLSVLHENGVTEGIRMDVLQTGLKAGCDIEAARGEEPVHGKDAVISYYRQSERKPAIREDGKANFYDMNFLDQVKKGDWLGEKTPPSEGVPGKTVTGEWQLPVKGKNKKLMYDKRTVGAYKEGGKTVLRALKDGVVERPGGKISVGDHLCISGDVGVETGNVEFDGSVSVSGTVMDGYSIRAQKDISILGEIGVSNVDRIESSAGDVYIKGGIFGKGRSVVRAGKNIFVKYANECTLEAGENIHIGCYSLGSSLKAKHIITDEKKGRLIGGRIEARGRVKAAVIGNMMERKTVIQVEGINRSELTEQLNNTLLLYKERLAELETIKKQLEVFDSFLDELNQSQDVRYQAIRKRYDSIMQDLFICDEKQKSLSEMLNIEGDGEVTAAKMAFPETLLEIKNVRKRVTEETRGTFYAQKNTLHFKNL